MLDSELLKWTFMGFMGTIRKGKNKQLYAKIYRVYLMGALYYILNKYLNSTQMIFQKTNQILIYFPKRKVMNKKNEITGFLFIVLLRLKFFYSYLEYKISTFRGQTASQ